MKTTIDLPDVLLIPAKKRAAEPGCSLRELVERGLRHELASGGPGRARRKRAVRWVTVPGGLPPGLDHGAREIWTHDRAFLSLPGLRVRDPLG